MEGSIQPRADKQLLDDFIREGREDSFNSLVQRYKLKLFNVAFRVLDDTHAAEDVTQRVFVRLVRCKDELINVRSPESWLYATTLRLSLDMHKSMQRRKKREAGAENSAVPETPREAAMRSELRREIDQALASLKSSLRIPLVLRYLQGLSYTETGEVMDLSSDTVRKRVKKALSVLRKLLIARGLVVPVVALEAGLRSLPAKAASASFLTSASSLIKAASTAAAAAKAAVTTTTVIKGGLMTTAKSKIAVGVGAAILAGGTVTYLATRGPHREPPGPPVESDGTRAGEEAGARMRSGNRAKVNETIRHHGKLLGQVVDAEGNALPGVLVEAGVFEGRSPDSLNEKVFVQSTTTDSNGQFRFPEQEAFSQVKELLASGVSPEEQSSKPRHSLLVASKKGYFAARQPVDFESLTGPQVLALRNEPEVSGWVIWKESREPIGRVKVVCRPEKSDIYQSPRAETRTDDEGEFRMTISAQGDAKLWAEFVNAYEPEPAKPNVRLVPGEKIANFALALELLSDSLVEGRVLDQHGGGVAGAEVRLCAEGNIGPEIRSGKDGRYRLMVPRDWSYQSYLMGDWPGGPEIATFSVTARGISVRPVDSSRRDLPDGKWDWAEYWTPPADAPPERIMAFHPDYEIGAVELPWFGVGQMRRGVDIVLYQGSRVSGTVSDDNSQPLAGAGIRIRVEPQEGGVLIREDLKKTGGEEPDGLIHKFRDELLDWYTMDRGVSAAKDGTYEIRFLRAGVYKLTASYTHCDSVTKSLELSPHQVVEDFDFVLTRKTGSIRGKVLDERGKPWTRGKVWVEVDDIPEAPSLATILTAKVQEDGSFKLSNLSYTFPGKYNLQFEVSGDCPEPAGVLWAAPLKDVPAGTEGMNIVVRDLPAGGLQVQVVDQANQPIQNFQLKSVCLGLSYGENAILGEKYSIGDLGKEVRTGWQSPQKRPWDDIGEERHYERDVVSESGEMLAQRVAPGKYLVTVETPGHGSLSREVEIRAGQHTEVIFELESLGEP